MVIATMSLPFSLWRRVRLVLAADCSGGSTGNVCVATCFAFGLPVMAARFAARRFPIDTASIDKLQVS